MKLIIEEEKWGKSRLLNEDGTMCCLGFYGKQCGYDIRTGVFLYYNPERGAYVEDGRPVMELTPELEWLLDILTHEDSFMLSQEGIEANNIQEALAEVNDRSDLSEAFRKGTITHLFKRYGNIDVEFV